MKRIILIMMSVITVFALAACGGNQVDDATAEKYIGNGEEIVSLITEGNLEEVYDKFDEVMKEGLPISNMAEITSLIEQSGTFEEINKSSVEEQDGYYIVVLVANYSEDNRTFTVTYNDQDEIAGLFIQ